MVGCTTTELMREVLSFSKLRSGLFPVFTSNRHKEPSVYDTTTKLPGPHVLLLLGETLATQVARTSVHWHSPVNRDVHDERGADKCIVLKGKKKKICVTIVNSSVKLFEGEKRNILANILSVQ